MRSEYRSDWRIADEGKRFATGQAKSRVRQVNCIGRFAISGVKSWRLPELLTPIGCSPSSFDGLGLGAKPPFTLVHIDLRALVPR